MSNVSFMHGNEAAAEGALAAGCRFYAGYPITPSTEIAEILSNRLPAVGGVFIQMEDEIASMAAIIGASLGGLKSATATSGPGFSLMQENLGFAVASEIPCVIINVQRVGPSTGLPTKAAQGDVMQARWGTHGDHPIIVLTPGNVGEAYFLCVRAFNLAERFRTPVVLLMDALVAQLKEKVVLPDRVEIVDRARPGEAGPDYKPFAFGDGAVAPLAPFGGKHRFHVTGLLHDERGFPTEDPEVVARWWKHMNSKLAAHLDEILAWDEVALDDADVAVVAYGGTARAAEHAVALARGHGVRAGLFKPTTLWPFPEDALRTLARRVKRIVVAEMNMGQIRLEVERLAAGRVPVAGVHHARAGARRHRGAAGGRRVNGDRLAFKPWGRLLQCLESIAWTLGPEHVPIVLSSLADAPGARGWNAPFNFVQGPAGRNIALAVGLRAAKPRTPLILVMNADSVSLGTNHLIHAARRNVGMTLLLLRAEIMREEGGLLDRASWQVPAHQRGLEQPSRPLDWVSALDAALVGRVNLDDAEAVIGLVLKALRTPGFSVIGVTTDTGLATGVLSECRWPEYFENYRAWAKPLRDAVGESAARAARSEPKPARHVPRYEVRIAGLGGHGVKLAGTVLSEAAGFHEGLWATQRGDYGSATRGGPSTVDVVIGSEPITYPGADHPDVLVVLSQQAADRYGACPKRGACLVVDPEEVPRPPPGAITIPVTGLAREYTGKPLAAGVVALGCVAATSGVVAMESLERSLAQHLPSGSLESNLAACAAGFSAARAALGGVTHA